MALDILDITANRNWNIIAVSFMLQDISKFKLLKNLEFLNPACHKFYTKNKFSTCTRRSVFGHRLMVMAALAQGLPVFLIPKQIRVAAMRLDMIHDGCRDEPSFLFASDAPRVAFQEELPGFLPFFPVATQHCTLPFAPALPFMFVTILSSVQHQLGASRIPARRLRSS